MPKKNFVIDRKSEEMFLEVPKLGLGPNDQFLTGLVRGRTMHLTRSATHVEMANQDESCDYLIMNKDDFDRGKNFEDSECLIRVAKINLTNLFKIFTK